MNATNNLCWTPLLEAAARGRVSAVAALLDAGADPNHLDRQGQGPLIMASLIGSVEAGRLLLAKGARVEEAMQPLKTTALHQAAMLGHAAFVRLLLDHGAPSGARDANGFTPLHSAASGLSATNVFGELSRMLRELSTHRSGDQSLAPAADAVAKQLIQWQADLPAEVMRGDRNHRQVAQLLLEKNAGLLEATNGAGRTPLILAAHFTNLPVVEVLLAHKANLNVHDAQNLTALHAAVLRGSLPLVTRLLEAGA